MTPREYLYDGPEVTSIAAALPWFLRTAWRLWRRRGVWTGGRARDAVVIVHGDTFSTLLGALVGKLAGCRVAHVESGLRSFNVLHPFPEELTRILTFRLSDFGYCPGEWACSNARRAGVSTVIDTHANTLLDALRVATSGSPSAHSPIEDGFILVSIHRFENLFSGERLTSILNFIESLAQKNRVVFVLHPSTRQRLAALGLLEHLRENANIELNDRMSYVPFMRLASRARLVVTDGGSNQEEMSYLGIPTVLMRMETERQEGIGGNVLLGRYDFEKIRDFAADALNRTTPAAFELPYERPSEVIMAHLDGVLSGAPDA